MTHSRLMLPGPRTAPPALRSLRGPHRVVRGVAMAAFAATMGTAAAQAPAKVIESPPPAAAPAPGSAVDIYRCIGKNNALSLRDSPCRPGEKQELRSMARPQDAPADMSIRSAEASSSSTRDTGTRRASGRDTRYIVVQAPRPMYECTTPDGDNYTSNTDAGNPRWVPLWTLGMPVWSRRDGGVLPADAGRGGHGGVNAALGPQGGGTWVRDECHALPQDEVCGRLSDRKYEILRRYGAVQPSERRALELEQRGLDARLDSDCRN